jgi:hypothetical protein
VGWSNEFQRKILKHGEGILWVVSVSLVAFVAFALFSSYRGFAGSFNFLVEERAVYVGTLLTYAVL